MESSRLTLTNWKKKKQTEVTVTSYAPPHWHADIQTDVTCKVNGSSQAKEPNADRSILVARPPD